MKRRGCGSGNGPVPNRISLPWRTPIFSLTSGFPQLRRNSVVFVTTPARSPGISLPWYAIPCPACGHTLAEVNPDPRPPLRPPQIPLVGDASLRKMRDSLYATQRLIEKSGGIGGRPTCRVLAFLRRPYIALAWWYRFSLIRAVAYELCNSARRIEGILTHRTNLGVLVGPLQGSTDLPLLNVRSYSLACSLSMQELQGRYPWFDSLDMIPAMQAFQWGSEWSSHDLDSSNGNSGALDS
jgi:hypothetical protein